MPPLGAEMAALHRQFHEERGRKVEELLQSYDLSKLEVVADFFERVYKIGIVLKPQNS